jgi:hypothetical protein
VSEIRRGPAGSPTTLQSYVVRESLASLISLDSSGFPDGCHAYVVSEQETYVLDTVSTFAAYGNLILARSVGAGRWFRKGKSYVVARYTLWYASYSHTLGNRLFGFTPGQLVASNDDAPDIIVNLNIDAPARIHRVICDNYGNIWTSSFRGGAIRWQAFKIRVADVASGTSTVTPSIVLNGAASAGLASPIDHINAIAFDKCNNLWLAGRNTGLAIGILQQIPSTMLSNDGTYSVIPPISIQGAPGLWHDLEKSMCFDGNSNLWLTAYYAPTVSKVLLSQRAVTDLALVPNVYWAGSNIEGPEGIAFGPAGLLWIVNYDSNCIKAYNPQDASGNPVPVITITSPSLVGPLYMSFDGSGNLWVLLFSNWTLIKFDAADLLVTGSIQPSVTLSYSGLVRATPPDSACDFCFFNDPSLGGLLPSGSPK